MAIDIDFHQYLFKKTESTNFEKQISWKMFRLGLGWLCVVKVLLLLVQIPFKESTPGNTLLTLLISKNSIKFLITFYQIKCYLMHKWAKPMQTCQNL